MTHPAYHHLIAWLNQGLPWPVVTRCGLGDRTSAFSNKFNDLQPVFLRSHSRSYVHFVPAARMQAPSGPFAPGILDMISELKLCSSSRDLHRGRQLHKAAIRNGADSNVFVASTIINMYSKCRSMEEARKAFDSVKDPDVVCWNALVSGYAANGEGAVALVLFSRMEGEGCPPNWSTFVAALKACTDLASKEEGNVKVMARDRGKRLHLLALETGRGSNIFVNNTLIDLFCKCGSMEEARRVFDTVEDPDVVCWNALILGYAVNGEENAALSMFVRMVRKGCSPDARSFVGALKAHTELATKQVVQSRENARKLHLLASVCGCDSNVYVQGTLVDMYARFGRTTESRRVFDSMKHPDVVCWNALILGYAQNGESDTALVLFSTLAREGFAPNERTFVAALKACTNLVDSSPELAIDRGKKLHMLVVQDGCDLHIYVQGTLLDMYARFGSMEDVRGVFDKMDHPNVVCWNTLVSGYAANGKPEVALDMFSKMARRDCTPDSRTFLSAVRACTELLSMEKEDKGRAIHMLSSGSGCDSDVFVGGALVDMYAKCGRMDLSRAVFDSLKQRDVVCWNVLISGYADNGKAEVSLQLFTRMKAEGCVPSPSVYISALKACLMLGALDTGRAVHAEVTSRGLEHDELVASCLVDFYAKCGSLAEAQKVFDLQPVKNVVIWTALIAGYSFYGDTRSVISLFGKMLDDAVQPSCVTFLCVLTACSHAGLVDKGNHYFQVMTTKYGIAPDLEHYTCMMDMLGRANKLDEAMALVRSMPYPHTSVTWTSILGACRKWKIVELGRLAFESLTGLEDANAGAYVQMANLCDSRGAVKQCIVAASDETLAATFASITDNRQRSVL